jgi:hypothetical protein
VNVNKTAPAAAAAERRTRTQAQYMQLAGTNIEDFDRALRTVAAERTGAAAERVEAEVTA